jgi:hypothetical protein
VLRFLQSKVWPKIFAGRTGRARALVDELGATVVTFDRSPLAPNVARHL